MKKIMIVSSMIILASLIQVLNIEDSRYLDDDISENTNHASSDGNIEHWSASIYSNPLSDYGPGFIDMVTDSNGNTFVLGNYEPNDVVVGNNSTNLEGYLPGFFISKMAPDGHWDWTIFESYTIFEVQATSLDLSNDGNLLYISGMTKHITNPDNSCVWVLDSSDGSINSQASFCATGGENEFSSVKAKEGGFYVVGFYESLPGNPFNLSSEHGEIASDEKNAIIIAIDEEGGVEWYSTTSTGDSNYNEVASDVTIDSSGNVHIIGTFEGEVYFGNQESSIAPNGLQDLFVWSLDSNGNTISVINSNTPATYENGDETITDPGPFAIPTTITAVGEKVVIGGEFAGSLNIGGETVYSNASGNTISYAGFVACLTAGNPSQWNWIQGVQDPAYIAPFSITQLQILHNWRVDDIMISDTNNIVVSGHHRLDIVTDEHTLGQSQFSGVFVGELSLEGTWGNLVNYDGNGEDIGSKLSMLPNGDIILGFESYSTNIQIAEHWYYTVNNTDRNMILTVMSWDADKDTISDDWDNCVDTHNPGQENFDGDEFGDACDNDDDNDLVLDGNDGCPYHYADTSDGCPEINILDTDGDGVHDGIDSCPDTPTDSLVDSTGCPGAGIVDTDGDGVHDGIDACPNTTEPYVDSTGCPQLFPPDTDGDGIIDNNDDCNDSLEDFDGFEDDDGCPELDNDGDGVVDSNDICPNLATGTDQFDNNSDGCPDYCDLNCETNPTEDNSSGETNDTELDEESSEDWWDDGDLTGEFIIGGIGLIGGGALGNAFGGPKGGKKKDSGFDITDAKDVYDFIADGKQDKKGKFPEPSGSDHYLRMGVARQEAMAISADINLDDYVEEK